MTLKSSARLSASLPAWLTWVSHYEPVQLVPEAEHDTSLFASCLFSSSSSLPLPSSSSLLFPLPHFFPTLSPCLAIPPTLSPCLAIPPALSPRLGPPFLCLFLLSSLSFSSYRFLQRNSRRELYPTPSTDRCYKLWTDTITTPHWWRVH